MAVPARRAGNALRGMRDRLRESAQADNRAPFAAWKCKISQSCVSIRSLFRLRPDGEREHPLRGDGFNSRYHARGFLHRKPGLYDRTRREAGVICHAVPQCEPVGLSFCRRRKRDWDGKPCNTGDHNRERGGARGRGGRNPRSAGSVRGGRKPGEGD